MNKNVNKNPEVSKNSNLKSRINNTLEYVDKFIIQFGVIKKYPFQTIGFLIIFIIVANYALGSELIVAHVVDSVNMVNGRLYDDGIETVDRIVFEGKAYSNQAPFPAVAFLPFAFLIKLTGDLEIWRLAPSLLLVVIAYLTWRLISLKLEYKKIDDKLWFLLAFLGSSVVFNLYLAPSYLSHPVATVLILMALVEYFTKKRLYLIGLYFGLIFLTRQLAVLGVLFFILSELSLVWDNFWRKNQLKQKVAEISDSNIYANTSKKTIWTKFKTIQRWLQKIKAIQKINFKQLISQTLPKVTKIIFSLSIFVFVAVLMTWGFNYIRFRDISWDKAAQNAVALNVYTEDGKLKPVYYRELKKIDTLNPKYIPGNFYFMFVHPGYYIVDQSYKNYYGDPNNPSNKPLFETYKYIGFWLKPPYLSLKNDANIAFGVGILVGTPYLLYLFGGKYARREDWFLILTILPMLLVLLCLVAVGANQYSARYTLDFWPFLFLLFLNQTKDRLDTNLKVIIFFTVLLNIWLIVGNF